MSNKSNNSRHNRAVMWKSTLIILFGVFIMGSITVYIVNQSPTLKETLASDRPVHRDAIVHLFAFLVEKNKDETNLSGDIVKTKKIIFEVSSNVPIYVALLTLGKAQRPDILLSDATIPPGEGRPLSLGINRFVYTAPAANQNNKFCLIYGQTHDELSLKLRRLSQAWSKIPPTQCASV